MPEPLREPLSEPLVSVIIPTRDRAVLVIHAIESVLAQTYPHLEILVVDDASADDTVAMIEQRFGERVRLVHNDVAVGVAQARNQGIALARGAYIAFLDSDDQWLPEKIARQVVIAERGAADVIYCHAANVDGTGTVLGVQRARHRGDVFRTMLRKNVVAGSVSALLVRRSCFDVVAPFRSGMYYEDWELWLRLALRFRFDYVDGVLVRIRHDPASRHWSMSIQDVIRSVSAAYDGVGPVPARLSRAVVSYHAGIHCAAKGERRAAARWLLRSVAALPLQKRAWFSLAVLVAGKRIPEAVKRLRSWFYTRR